MATDYNDGLRILRKIAEDEKNWRTGMQQIGELLDAAQKADAALLGFEQRKLSLTAEVKNLEIKQVALDKEIQRLQGSLDGFSAELSTREQEKAAVIASLNAQIREKEEALATVSAAFDEFKKSHGMV